jgi:hypothetical protein
MISTAGWSWPGECGQFSAHFRKRESNDLAMSSVNSGSPFSRRFRGDERKEFVIGIGL